MAANSMFLTLNQAAKEARKSPSTIHKAIKSGRLSYTSKDDSGYKIDPAELFRVFPKENRQNTKNERKRIQENGGERASEYLELKHKLDLTAKDLEHERQRSKAVESERDKWQEQAEKWQQQAERLSLTYQPAVTQKPVEHDTEESEGREPDNQTEAISGPLWAFLGVSIGLVVALGAVIAIKF